MDRSNYYTVVHPEKFAFNWTAFYDKIESMTKTVRRNIPNLLNIDYVGNGDPKQRLDLYFPQRRDSGKNNPVFIFLHGGGFREGDKDDYGFVAAPFSAKRIIAVVASYRWAPQFHFPSQVDDTKRILLWVFSNIEKHGGNANQIYLGGHSAGAILCASVSVESSWTKGYQSLPRDVVKGFFPISGEYDLRKSIMANPYVDDASLLSQASPALNIVDPPPSIVAVGSKEDIFLDPSIAFVTRLVERKRRKDTPSSKLLVLDGMEHADTVLALGDEQSVLFREIAATIHELGQEGA